jgi:hypothetical protein
MRLFSRSAGALLRVSTTLEFILTDRYQTSTEHATGVVAELPWSFHG